MDAVMILSMASLPTRSPPEWPLARGSEDRAGLQQCTLVWLYQLWKIWKHFTTDQQMTTALCPLSTLAAPEILGPLASPGGTSGPM